MSWGTFAVDTSYDFWLDYYGVGGKKRKELRRELRANLDEASADRGWASARAGLGSVRHLAKQNAEDLVSPGRLALSAGAIAAATTFAVVVLWVLWTMFAFADGVLATGIAPGQSVAAPVTLLPGSSFTAGRPAGGGIEFSMHVSPWLIIVPPVVAFVLVARPWRLLGRD